MKAKNVERFEKCWGKFITKLKGRMIKQSEQQQLTYPLLKLTLSDAASCWGSEYEENGRWLMQYSEEEPEKGRLIHRILLENMEFIEIPLQKDMTDMLNYAVPLAGAAAGLGLSHLFRVKAIGQAISTIVPAAVLYPSMKTLGENIKKQESMERIEQYLSQLEPYRQNIIDIIDGD